MGAAGLAVGPQTQNRVFENVKGDFHETFVKRKQVTFVSDQSTQNTDKLKEYTYITILYIGQLRSP